MSGPFNAIDRGARARLTADTPDGWHEPARKGKEFEVEEYVPALKEGDHYFGDDDDAIQVAFYYGSADGGVNNVCVPADIVEEAMSAEAMNARGIPSIAVASRMVQDGLMNTSGEGGEFFESQVSGEDGGEYVEAYGRTDDGLGFGVKVAVLEVWRTDD